MLDHISQMYLRRIKIIQKMQETCEWGYIAGFITIALGFFASIMFFTRHADTKPTITLLMSGLILICLSSIVAELTRFSEIRIQNKLEKYLLEQAASPEPLNKLTVDRHVKTTFNQTAIAGQPHHLKNKTISG